VFVYNREEWALQRDLILLLDTPIQPHQLGISQHQHLNGPPPQRINRRTGDLQATESFALHSPPRPTHNTRQSMSASNNSTTSNKHQTNKLCAALDDAEVDAMPVPAKPIVPFAFVTSESG
jgi:hypothetical protein